MLVFEVYAGAEIGTNSLKCKCEKILCMKHRMFNAHNCSIDYKTNDIKILEKNNPKIISDKIISI